MNNRDKMVSALHGLPEWDPLSDKEMIHEPAVKLFLPGSGATWFLLEKDTSDESDVRFFGLCDLGLGMPELGWVDEYSLLHIKSKFTNPVELDEHFNGTLEDGYEYVNK